MKLTISLKRRTAIFGLGVALLVVLTLWTRQAARSHEETARWAVMNQTLRFGATMVVLNQVSVVNYGPFRRFYIRFPFSHMIEGLRDSIRDGIKALVYFYGPCPVTPAQSRVTISAEIRYVPEAGTPDLAFSLEGCQDARPGFPQEGTNVIFQDVLTGHIPWKQERFVLTITDRKTGIRQQSCGRRSGRPRGINSAIWERQGHPKSFPCCTISLIPLVDSFTKGATWNGKIASSLM